jgi:hypothetical protein
MAPQSERNVVVVDAPSNLGLRPPSPGAIPGCWRLPEVLRQQGIVARLGANDGGRVQPPPYTPDHDATGTRNGLAIADYAGYSQCKLCSVTLMRRLSSNSRKNQIYKAFREVGRVMRTVALLRFLADSGLRARVTAATNKAEAYNGFSAWTPVRQPGRDRRERPGRAGKSVKWNSLLCNLIVFHTAIDMMEVIRQLVAEGWQVTAEDLAQLSPYLTSHILRFGAYATDELHIPPDVFDPALDEVDFGGEQPAAA